MRRCYNFLCVGRLALSCAVIRVQRIAILDNRLFTFDRRVLTWKNTVVLKNSQLKRESDLHTLAVGRICFQLLDNMQALVSSL